MGHRERRARGDRDDDARRGWLAVPAVLTVSYVCDGSTEKWLVRSLEAAYSGYSPLPPFYSCVPCPMTKWA